MRHNAYMHDTKMEYAIYQCDISKKYIKKIDFNISVIGKCIFIMHTGALSQLMGYKLYVN